MGGLDTMFAADVQKQYLSGLDVKLIEACMQKAKIEDERRLCPSKMAREAVIKHAILYALAETKLIYLRGRLISDGNLQPGAVEEAEEATNQAGHNHTWLARYKRSRSLLGTEAYFALTMPITWRAT